VIDPEQLPGRDEAPGGGHVSVDHAAASSTIVLRGEIDASVGDRLDGLRAEAVAAGYAVTLDVTDVPFMDSSGASFLVRLTQGVAPQRVQVLRPSNQVLYLLNLTQLSTLVDIAH
jgi:anti-anti-sigma factor